MIITPAVIQRLKKVIAKLNRRNCDNNGMVFGPEGSILLTNSMKTTRVTRILIDRVTFSPASVGK